MANFQCFFLYVILYVCLLHGSDGLYEDQVGLYDWYQQYIGPVSYVSIDPTTSTNRGIVVASETGVLASIDALSGELVWRRVFAPGKNGHIDAVLRTQGGSLMSVSKSGKLIRSWDTITGVLKWEAVTELTVEPLSKPLPLSEVWRPGAVQATLTGPKQKLVVVAGSQELQAHSVRTGEAVWSQILNLPDEALLCTVFGGESAVYTIAAIQRSKLILSTFAPSTGVLVRTRELSAPWLSMETTSCLATSSHLVCLESSKLDLYHTTLSSDTPFTLSMLTSLLDLVATDNQQSRILPAASPDSVWVEVGLTKWQLSIQDEQVSVTSKGDDVIPVVGDKRGVVVSGGGRRLSVGDVAYKLNENRGNPTHGSIQLSGIGTGNYNLVLIMEDHTIVMLNQDAVVWSREDALGAIAAVEMLDLPAGQSEQIEAFVEMTKSEVNPLKVFVLRAQLQFTLAKEFLVNLNQEVASLLHDDGSHLVRDRFNTRKLIVAATANGKLYGVDSRNGEVVWQTFVSSFAAFQDGRPLLYILRTTSHPPHPPLAVLIGRSLRPSCYGATVVYEFNPLTGELLNPDVSCLSFRVIQAFLLAVLDESHSKVLLLMTDDDNTVTTYPSYAPDKSSPLSELKEQPFFFVAKQGGSEITGHRVDLSPQPSPSGGTVYETEQLWRVELPAESERIVSVKGKRATERVSSQGDVLTDRSVQYKYLNPNLVAVVTESVDPSKGLVTMYLIDSVTGGIVYHTTHKSAQGPVHLVHSENWVIYQFLNTKQRRHELVVLELYETHTNQSHTVWSSLAPPPTPAVMSQAYAFPSALNTVTTTHTLRGITYKAILFGMHSGRVAVMPKSLLNPRRELEVTDQMKEDGIPPYHPELGLSPLAFVNYNHTIARIRNIYTTPSGLESTCLVFVCGLDLYFTRVTPSNQFDLLADDFDYTLISAVVLAMFVATVVLSRLAARKTLKSLWK